ncbi:hypothetical protein DL98DRAFT_640548, partial [Cadophora sp. DSE1049]
PTIHATCSVCCQKGAVLFNQLDTRASIKELRERAIADPSSITDMEKLLILGWPSREDSVSNVLRATLGVLTPDQLLQKAASQPDSLKLGECWIILDRFHYHTDSSGSRERRTQALPMSRPDLSLFVRAEKAVLTPQEKEALANAHAASSCLIAGLKDPPKWKARMEFLSKSASWVRKVGELYAHAVMLL